MSCGKKFVPSRNSRAVNGAYAACPTSRAIQRKRKITKLEARHYESLQASIDPSTGHLVDVLRFRRLRAAGCHTAGFRRRLATGRPAGGPGFVRAGVTESCRVAACCAEPPETQ